MSKRFAFGGFAFLSAAVIAACSGSSGSFNGIIPSDGLDASLDEGGPPTGACAGVTCASPPPNECVDPSTLKSYAAHGACGSDGACSYTSTTTPCAAGCKDGKCIGNPCAGVTCASPPKNVCADGSTLTVYSQAGRCTQDGSCSYGTTNQKCAAGCADGKCKGDPCIGVHAFRLRRIAATMQIRFVRIPLPVAAKGTAPANTPLGRGSAISGARRANAKMTRALG